MLERDIEKHLVARVKELRGEIRKVHWGGRSKAPDRVVMLPYRSERMAAALKHFNLPTDHLGSRTLWVELKNPETIRHFPSNAHERAQHREHERMRAVGQTVLVLGTIEQIDEALA